MKGGWRVAAAAAEADGNAPVAALNVPASSLCGAIARLNHPTPE